MILSSLAPSAGNSIGVGEIEGPKAPIASESLAERGASWGPEDERENAPIDSVACGGGYVEVYVRGFKTVGIWKISGTNFNE